MLECVPVVCTDGWMADNVCACVCAMCLLTYLCVKGCGSV